jgi:hypothetical protein
LRLRPARRHDQAVVGDLPRPVEQAAGHRAALEVDPADFGERDMRVTLVAEDVSKRRRDVPLGENPSGDVVEQRLKEVVRLPVDQGDLDGRSP